MLDSTTVRFKSIINFIINKFLNFNLFLMYVVRTKSTYIVSYARIKVIGVPLK